MAIWKNFLMKNGNSFFVCKLSRQTKNSCFKLFNGKES